VPLQVPCSTEYLHSFIWEDSIANASNYPTQRIDGVDSVAGMLRRAARPRIGAVAIASIIYCERDVHPDIHFPAVITAVLTTMRLGQMIIAV
jgi:hypothetical protein